MGEGSETWDCRAASLGCATAPLVGGLQRPCRDGAGDVLAVFGLRSGYLIGKRPVGDWPADEHQHHAGPHHDD